MYYPKLSKKIRKDCSDCRACNHDVFSSSNCSLYFKTGSKEIVGYPISIPLEPCPKPLTYDQYFLCREVYKSRWSVN